MRHINFRALISSAAVFTVGAWFAILIVNGIPTEINFLSLKYVPSAISVDFALWFIFVKWAWRWRVFQGWLVRFPVIHGTWHGTLKSIWVDKATGASMDPIPIVLVIKQSFLRVDCEVLSYTDESSSQSYVAEFYIDTESGAKSLVYTYRNVPRVTVRDRSAIHDGTALLKIITKPKRKLKGEYWTNRKTVGEIELSFYSNELEQAFPKSLIKV